MRALAKHSVAELLIELLLRAQQARFAAIQRAEATLAALRAKHARAAAEILRQLDSLNAAKRARSAVRQSKIVNLKSKIR